MSIKYLDLSSFHHYFRKLADHYLALLVFKQKWQQKQYTDLLLKWFLTCFRTSYSISLLDFSFFYTLEGLIFFSFIRI